MLTGFWYRALPADRVHRHNLYKATLLEIPLVIGRDRLGHPPSPCATPQVPTAVCRCTAAGSTERIWSVDITDGSSTCTMASADTDPSAHRRPKSLKVDRIYSRAAIPAKSKTVLSGSTFRIRPPPGAQDSPRPPSPRRSAANRKIHQQIQSRLPAGRNARQHRPRHHR